MATILAVDDRPADRKLLVTLFKDRHRVLEAADGAQALELVRAEHPDLVISDVLLPQMDGYEFVRQLRTDPAISGTPVIFYTAAFNEQEARDLARDFGVVLTLSKPTDPKKILEKVAEVLSTERAQEMAPLSPHLQDKHQQLLVDKLLRQVEELNQEILERKLVEMKLKSTLEDLERSNRELEEFAYVASHDLKEPLRIMANFSDFLTQHYRNQLDEQAQKYLGYIADGAAHMQQLINDLLAYAQVGRGNFPLISANLEDILKGALNDILLLINETGAKISHDPLPTLKVNPYKMRRLFENLISNAIKYRGNFHPNIHISARREGEEWVLSVRDTGIGFDPQHAQSIFKVFKRLHSKEKYSGTGIGLAICKKIVERHGGRIWAESEPGQGATFYFTIPA